MLEGRARFSALGDDWGAAISSHYLGTIALRQGDFEAARDLTREMLVSARALGDRYRISRNLYQLAEVDVAQGRLADAARHLHEGLTLTCQQGRAGDAAQLLRLLALVAFRTGHEVAAARLAGLADRHAGAERTMPPDEPRAHADLLLQLRESLGTRFDPEFAAGAATTFEQALSLGAELVEDSE